VRFDAGRIFAAIAALVGAPAGDDRRFAGGLARLLAAVVPFDHVVVFGYRGDERPIDLWHTFDPAAYAVFVSEYQAGPYLLDPFFRASRERRRGFFRMRDLAPDRFFSSEYVRSYYVRTGLAEEVGFFVPLEGGAGVVLSLMRARASGVFPARGVAALVEIEPVVTALMARHWADLAARFDGGERATAGRRGRPAPSPDAVWTRLGLTGREAAVVGLVLQGHSSESVADRLGIATGTVKVHRRNVYRKLGIASQTQLLSLYLTHLSGAAPPDGTGGG
jgi:DNA-binding CsgD family transcriptional regulator